MSVHGVLENGLAGVESSINYVFSKIPQKQPDPSRVNKIKLVAHRGAHDNKKYVIENTCDAFDEAVRLGCWGIEFDVRFTKDGVLVVHHDETLERLWNFKHSLKELTYAELKNIAPYVPRLEDVLEQFAHQVHCFIELKEPITNAKILSDILNKYTPKEDYHIISLDPQILHSLEGIDPDLLFLVPIFNVNKFCEISIKKKYAGLLGHFLMFRDKHISLLRDAKQQVGVGIVDSQMSLYRELNRDVDLIFTNQASNIITLLKNLNTFN